MMSTLTPDIRPNLQKLLRRFERWRSGHAGRLPIPDRLWAPAVELAREHGVFHTAKALHLEYGKLKRLLESSSREALPRRARARRVERRGVRSLPPAPGELGGDGADDGVREERSDESSQPFDQGSAGLSAHTAFS